MTIAKTETVGQAGHRWALAWLRIFGKVSYAAHPPTHERDTPDRNFRKCHRPLKSPKARSR